MAGSLSPISPRVAHHVGAKNNGQFSLDVGRGHCPPLNEGRSSVERSKIPTLRGGLGEERGGRRDGLCRQANWKCRFTHKAVIMKRLFEARSCCSGRITVGRKDPVTGLSCVRPTRCT